MVGLHYRVSSEVVALGLAAAAPVRVCEQERRGVCGHRRQWNRAQALLREHILAALNVLLARFGLGRLDVRGLPSTSELSLSIDRLQRGEISVEEALASARVWDLADRERARVKT